MTKINKKDCEGCTDNFYNGNNPLEVKECWHFKTAQLVLRKRVHMQQTPPWTQKPVRVPSCYKEQGYVYIEKKRKY